MRTYIFAWLQKVGVGQWTWLLHCGRETCKLCSNVLLEIDSCSVPVAPWLLHWLEQEKCNRNMIPITTDITTNI